MDCGGFLQRSHVWWNAAERTWGHTGAPQPQDVSPCYAGPGSNPRFPQQKNELGVSEPASVSKAYGSKQKEASGFFWIPSPISLPGCPGEPSSVRLSEIFMKLNLCKVQKPILPRLSPALQNQLRPGRLWSVKQNATLLLRSARSQLSVAMSTNI